jgi:hypothetical protein
MGFAYTLTITCDARDAPDCERLTTVTGADRSVLDHLVAGAFGRGWAVGGDSGTVRTVCPACCADAIRKAYREAEARRRDAGGREGPDA